VSFALPLPLLSKLARIGKEAFRHEEDPGQAGRLQGLGRFCSSRAVSFGAASLS